MQQKLKSAQPRSAEDEQQDGAHKGGQSSTQLCTRVTKAHGELAHTVIHNPAGIIACSPTAVVQATVALAGVAIGAGAFAGKYLINAAVRWSNAPPAMRAFYKVSCWFRPVGWGCSCLSLGDEHAVQGGFQSTMTRREAGLILGVRESAAEDRVKEAHRRVMIANHPDSGKDRPKLDLSAALLAALS